MGKQKLNINGNLMEFSSPKEIPLLWALRDFLKLKGTKFGCGQGLCGACTVTINGEAVRSCQITVSDLELKDEIETIEGMSKNDKHKIVEAWEELNVPQCGYCQPGQMMNACSFLKDNKFPKTEEITEAMSGNICRCGTYQRIKEAVQLAADKKRGKVWGL